MRFYPVGRRALPVSTAQKDAYAVDSAVYSAVETVGSAVYSAVDSGLRTAVETVGSAVYSAVYSAVWSAVRSAVEAERMKG